MLGEVGGEVTSTWRSPPIGENTITGGQHVTKRQKGTCYTFPESVQHVDGKPEKFSFSSVVKFDKSY